MSVCLSVLVPRSIHIFHFAASISRTSSIGRWTHLSSSTVKGLKEVSNLQSLFFLSINNECLCLCVSVRVCIHSHTHIYICICFLLFIYYFFYLFTFLSDLQGSLWIYLQGNNKALSRYPASCGLIVINLLQLKCVFLSFFFFHALTSMDIVYMQRETVEEHFQAMSLSKHSSEQFRHTSR